MYDQVKIGVLWGDACGVCGVVGGVVCGSGIWKIVRNHVWFKYSLSSPPLPGHQLSDLNRYQQPYGAVHLKSNEI